MSPVETTILIVALVAIVALAMRLLSGGSREKGEPAAPPAAQVVDEFLRCEFGDEAVEGEIVEAVAITSDGWAFVPDGDEVQLIPPGRDDEVVPVRSNTTTGIDPQTDPSIQLVGGRGAPINPRTGKRLSDWRPGEHLDAGDLIAARVRRGAPDFDPWRLEAIGRDREYRAWAFETEDAAAAALALLKHRIVRAPIDENGDLMPVMDAEFDEAKRRDEETERQLDLPDEEPQSPAS